MDLIKCPWCEKTISDENTRCPLCKRPLDAKPSEIAFFHAAQQKDAAYRTSTQEMRTQSRPAVEEEDDDEPLVFTGRTEYCRFCGEKIPRGSRECPFCDSRLRHSKLWLWVLVIALVVLAYYLGGR